MTAIDHSQLRRLVDLRPLDALNTRIAGISEAKDRNRFIDAHGCACSAMRPALWMVGHMKCWYSEALLQEGEGEVEHYRPKKRLSGAHHAGYWWRAFDWQNLRLAHPTVNRRRRDYLTRRPAGKGSYFPLHDEACRATCLAEEANEEPLLLDPVVASDTRLLCFAEDSGSPRPARTREQDEWLYRRAEESIDYYHLNEGSWNAKRMDLMAEVKALCAELESIKARQPRDDPAYDRTIDRILDYIGPYAEFSAACRQVVIGMGLLEVFS